MKFCKHCHTDIAKGESCLNIPIVTGGKVYEPIRYGKEPWSEAVETCPVCNVPKGARHHPGCSIEQCPACGEPLVECGCIYVDIEPVKTA